MPFVRVTATASKEAAKIVQAFVDVTAHITAKNKAKGVFKPVRCLILGVPNCGKSTIINCLSGRKAVITGDKPGVTKGKQWVRLTNGLELLDTPGTLWSKFEDEVVARRLCFIGSIKDDVVDIEEVALALIAELQNMYPDLLAARYGVEVHDKPPIEVYNAIAAKRGFLLRGGRKRDAGLNAEQLAQWAKEARYFLHTIFMVDNLDALHRGGRLPKGVAVIGDALDVKALLHFNLDGTLGIRGVARGRKKGLRKIVDFFEKTRELKPYGHVCCVGDADAPDDGYAIASELHEFDPELAITRPTIGPTIGSHVGPGMVSCCFWGKDRRQDKQITRVKGVRN